MKVSFRSIAAIPCLVALLAISSSAHASIVTNGNFSAGMTGWNPSGTGTTPGIGITAINLNVPDSTGYGDFIPTSPGGSSTAAYFVDDNALESISQTVILNSFSTYVLSFDLFATNSGSGNQYNFQLTDSVGLIASSSFGNGPQAGDTSVPVGVWTPETLTFTTGAATSYNLAFNYTAGATPSKDVVLTDVSIDPASKGTSPVPEPGSIVLLGSGLISAAGLVRRRFSK